MAGIEDIINSIFMLSLVVLCSVTKSHLVTCGVTVP